MNALQSLASQNLEVSLAMSLVIAVLLLLRPVLGKRYRTNTFYWIWLLAALRLAVPLNGSFFPALVKINAPDAVLVYSDVSEADSAAPSVMKPGLPQDTADDAPSKQAEALPAADKVLTVGQLVSVLWASGAGLYFAGNLIAYARFRRRLRRWSQSYTDGDGRKLFQALQQETGAANISLALCDAVPSPFVTGFFRPVLFLPKDGYTDSELEAIFRHELLHVRRHDLWYKLLLLIARSLHWFNPAVHWMARRAEKDLEISCDEAVVRGKPVSFQAQYGHAVLSAAEYGLTLSASLTTHFRGGKNTMKERLSAISGKTGQHNGFFAVCLAALALILAAAGCSLNHSAANLSSAESSATPAVLDGEPSTEANDMPYGQPKDFDADSLPAAFVAAIERYCYDGTFPDGQGSGYIPSSISYAVYDADRDGQDELLLQNASTITAGMTERIYALEDGVFREELSAFPALTYYENGVILAAWSHNQGVGAQRIWPYTLYQYQTETGRYEILGSVDAWDREQAASLDSLGAFPDATDADGDGCVYFLLPPDWEGDYGRARIADGPEYERWGDQYLGGANTLDIPYQEVEIETVYPDAAG